MSEFIGSALSNAAGGPSNGQLTLTTGDGISGISITLTDASSSFNVGDTLSFDDDGNPGTVTYVGYVTINGVNYPAVQDSVGQYLVVGIDTAGTYTFESGSIPCYVAGTWIATARGPVAVEALAIGDEVTTLEGCDKPIKWVGQRSYDGRFVAGNRAVLPICVRAGALGENRPSRDLWISPHHALYLEGVLIEAKDLVNGVSIVQAGQVERVDYFHIELDNHDVIFAEGAPAESFIDHDSRAMFHNAAEYAALYPGQGQAAPRASFAPRVESGFELEAARAGIAARAGLQAPAGPLGALRGWIERIDARSVAGWALNSENAATPVVLEICADGRKIGVALANGHRADLEAAGLGVGRCAFAFTAPEGVDLTQARIEVRRACDGAALAGPASAAA